MNWNAPCILAIVGSGLVIASLFKPSHPLLAVGALLIGVAVVVIAGGK